MEDENQRLKRLVADLSLDKETFQEVLKQTFLGRLRSVRRWIFCEGLTTSACDGDVVGVMEALRVLSNRLPKRIQTDNGSEFISKNLEK